jgi:hypothetical protein
VDYGNVQFWHGFGLLPPGRIQVASLAGIDFSSGLVQSGGTIALDANSAMSVTGLYAMSGGEIDATNAVVSLLRDQEGDTGNGDLDLTNGNINFLRSTLNADGEVDLAGGTATLNASSVSTKNGLHIKTTGLLSVQGYTQDRGNVLNEGQLKLESLPNAKWPNPVDGQFDITGNYVQTYAATAQFRLVSQGDYSYLDVHGTANIASAVNVDAWNGYLPPVGSWFDLIDSDVLPRPVSAGVLPPTNGGHWEQENLSPAESGDGLWHFIIYVADDGITTAYNDNYSTYMNQTLIVGIPGVLGNDTSTSGNPITAVLNSQPANGIVTLNANGSFVYTPNPNFTGIDSFTYHDNDGINNSNVATVYIDVIYVPPTVNDGSYGTGMNQTLTVGAPGVLAGAIDPSGLPLTAVLQSLPSDGTLTLNPDGSFSYTPNAGFTGTDSFTFGATDGIGSSNTATVWIDVFGPPEATDESFYTPQGQSLTFTSAGILAGAFSPSNAPLSIVIDTLPTNGTWSQNPDGSYTYVPNSGFTGNDSFTYYVNDGFNNSNEATGVITVYGAPQAMDDSFSTAQNQQLTVAAPGLLDDVGYSGNQSLSVSLASQATHGSVALNADGSFRYTPNAGFIGTDSFTYVATDGTFTSNVATVSISVQNVTPTASNQYYSAWAGQTLSVSASSGLLTNASSPTNARLTAVVVSQPNSGTLTVNADGSFTYTPAAGFTGTVTFTYYVTDGTKNSNIATVTLDIQAQFGGG